MKLPDVIIERLIQRADDESSSKLATAREMGAIWEELKHGLVAELAVENKWDEPNMGKTRTWYIESVCASVAKIAHKSGYNRMRVWDQVLSRKLDEKYDEGEVLSFSDYLFLLQNLKKDKRGLIPEEKIKERVDWYFEEFEKYGKPPGTRDIEKHSQINGEKPEWLLLWKKIIRIAKQMSKLEKIPKALQAIIKSLLLSADADYTGGELKDEKKLALTVLAPREYEVPTVIYKDSSGYTGAMNDRRER